MSASKLRQRTLTALLIAPLTVAAVLWLPPAYLALCLGLILVPAAWEWSAMAGIAVRAGRFAYVAVVALCLLLLWQPPLRQWYVHMMAAAAVFWGAVAFLLFRLRTVECKSGPEPVMAAVGLVVLIGPWLAILHLHAHSSAGPYLVIFLLVLIWVVDTLAYFTGRRWGREKLAPLLSPGKTRAGVYGALVGAGLCGILLGWSLGLSLGYAMLLVALCVLVALVSMIGDLFESFVKRSRDLKDSGQLLPGHGGILDRIDSLTAAAPLFTLGILWLDAQLMILSNGG
ncbi:phosphatidate cytidylyltransferase [Candidatus Thiosymbion oneisti]|uniref:phosphatidate cytidylyltransferase n=1 Tax=Candidatus Thiosymbion oneisti TaxID=589554 RepID=UPI000B030689|nr:phosphatidate cytidylyltransferase [Candidatus Thiosymbion oneisti]